MATGSPITGRGVRSLQQPAWGGPANSKNITVVLPASVDDSAITELIHAHPELNTATWQVNIPPANRFAQPRTYAVRGRFPEQRLRGLWQQIVDQIGPDDEAEATTNTNDIHTPARMEISVESGSGEQQRFEHIAHAVTPLLPGLGLPVYFRLLAQVDQIQFTLAAAIHPTRPTHPHHWKANCAGDTTTAEAEKAVQSRPAPSPPTATPTTVSPGSGTPRVGSHLQQLATPRKVIVVLADWSTSSSDS